MFGLDSLFVSPQKSATAALAASSIQPEGAAIVSGENGLDQSLFGKLASIASGFVKRTAVATTDALKPANLAVPGGTKAAVVAEKVATSAQGVAKSAAGALDSAGAGIKSGFRIGVVVLMLVAFLFLRHHLK